MKNVINTAVVQLDKATLKSFTTEVKETIAKDITLLDTADNSMSAATMWKIQRNARSASQMVRRS